MFDNLKSTIVENLFSVVLVVYLLIFGICCDGIGDIFQGKWLIWLVILLIMCKVISAFFKSLEENSSVVLEPITLEPASPSTFKGWIKGIGKSIMKMSIWDYLRWILTIGFLTAACFIMHESLVQLWLHTDGFGKIFCWFLSIIIILTLFWISGYFSYKFTKLSKSARPKFVIICFAMYLLFDIAAFTFNYFHIYSNFGETQIMIQSLRAGEELNKYLSPKISSDRMSSDVKTDSIKSVRKEIEYNISNYERRIKDLQNQLQATPKMIRNRDTSYINPVYSQLEKKITALYGDMDYYTKKHPLPTGYLAESVILGQTDSLLNAMNSIILDLNQSLINDNDNKIKHRDLKSELVKTENNLYGVINTDLQKDTLVMKYHTIVNTRSIDQKQALEDLFELIGGKYKENHAAITSAGEKEMHELLHKESIRSMAMSALIDLAPLLLAMLAALFTVTNKNY